MPLIAQKDFFVRIDSSFTDDSAQLQSFHGVECLSSLFEYDAVFTSKNDSINLDKALKSPINIHIKTDSHERFFAGIVAEFAQGATVRKDEEYLTEYYVKIRPQFWLLTLDRNYLMFQEKTAMDIIKKVLKDCGVKDTSDNVQSSGKKKREYCVQYEESSFNFVSRLLEEEGIAYFFKHTNSGHTLVLADSSSAFKNISGNSKIPFAKNIDASLNFGNVFNIRKKSAVTTGGSALADYNYKISQTELYKKLDSQWKGLPFYEYPAGFDSMSIGESLSKLRVEQFEFDHNSIIATSTVPEFTPGYVFELTGHHSAKFNDNYVLHSVEHDIRVRPENGQYIYENRFRAFQKNTVFRPPRITPKPKIWGLQSAIVVCPANQEIYCDKFGCIKVHFYWDRFGKAKNTNDSSCWIRVARPIAGNGWGSLFTPRVGQEVLVAFSEGNPDRPIVVGATYNDKHIPLYAEKEPMKSSLKTVSYKDNEKGFNEMRFYDEKDKEEYYQHAQKDMFIEIENSRTTHIKESDDTLIISKGNSYTTLESKGSATKHSLLIVKGDKSVELDKGNTSYLLKDGNETVTLNKGDCTVTLDNGNCSVTLSSGNVTVDVTGNITVKATGDISVSAEKNISLEAKQEIKMKAGTKITVEAGTDMNCKAGGNFSVQASMDMTCKASMNFKVQASTGVEIKSSLKLAIEGLTSDIKGTISLNMQAAAAAKVMGAVLNLQGSGTINNTSAMIRLGGPVKIG